jgi:hypothetical protein
MSKNIVQPNNEPSLEGEKNTLGAGKSIVDTLNNSIIPEKRRIHKIVAGSRNTTINFGDIKIESYVIQGDDKDLPVLSGRGMQKALGLPNKSGTELSSLLKSFAKKTTVDPILLDSIENYYSFKRDGAGGSQVATNGYVAGTLIRICILFRDNNRLFTEENQFIPENASKIIDNFAIEGIERVVFRVTGYDDIQNERILESY